MYAPYIVINTSWVHYIDSAHVGLLLLTRIFCSQIHGTRPALFKGGGASPRSGP